MLVGVRERSYMDCGDKNLIGCAALTFKECRAGGMCGDLYYRVRVLLGSNCTDNM